MSKLNKILLAVILFLVVVLSGVVYWQKFKNSDDYWAVYLSTGDIYVGKLSYFPRFHLTDVWFFQETGDAKTPLSLSKFTKAFWGPEDNLYLNEKQIIWKNKLSEASQVVSFIRNPQSVNAQNQAPAQTQTEEGASE